MHSPVCIHVYLSVYTSISLVVDLPVYTDIYCIFLLPYQPDILLHMEMYESILYLYSHLSVYPSINLYTSYSIFIISLYICLYICIPPYSSSIIKKQRRPSILTQKNSGTACSPYCVPSTLWPSWSPWPSCWPWWTTKPASISVPGCSAFQAVIWRKGVLLLLVRECYLCRM